MPKRELKLGEIICPKCEGEGSIDVDSCIIKVCDKCEGDGIVDWVSIAMQKPKNEFIYSGHDDKVYTSQAIMAYIDNNSFKLSADMEEAVSKIVEKKIKEAIDDYMLRTINDAVEQKIKQYIKGGSIDNGIIP